MDFTSGAEFTSGAGFPCALGGGFFARSASSLVVGGVGGAGGDVGSVGADVGRAVAMEVDGGGVGECGSSAPFSNLL